MRSVWALILTLAICCAAGCTHGDRIDPVLKHYQSGEFELAAALVRDPKFVEKHPRRQDRLLMMLERGKVLQDAGDLSASRQVFAEADRLLEQIEQDALVRVGEEITASLLSQTARRYDGPHSDRILLNTLQAINELLLGNLEQAGVQMRRAFDRQALAVQYQQRAVRSASEQAEKRQPGASQVTSRTEVLQAYRQLETEVNPGYADFVNPLTTYLSGLVKFMQGDVANARIDLRRAAAMAPRHPVLEMELAGQGIERAMSAERRAMVYVIVDQGVAPGRERVLLTIPVGPNHIVPIGFPIPRFQSAPVEAVEVRSGSGTVRTHTLLDYNAMIATEYRTALPAMILRLAIAAFIREGIDQGVRAGLGDRQNTTEGQLAILATQIFKIASAADVDLRSWRTPGAAYQVAALPRPPDGRLTLQPIAGGRPAGQAHTVDLPDQRVCFVFARIPSVHTMSVNVGGVSPRGGR